MPDFRWQVYHAAVIRKFDFEAAEITRRLGLSPTRTFRAGDSILAGGTTCYRVNGWVLETRHREFDTEALNQHGLADLGALISELHTRQEVVRSICPPADLSFRTILASDSPNPGCCLSHENARRIADLGATWEVSVWTGVAD